MTGPGGAFVGTYFDGVRAARRRVHAEVSGKSLHIRDAATGAPIVVWPVEALVEHRQERATGMAVFGPEDSDARLEVTGDGIIRDMRAALPGLAARGVPWPMVRRVGALAVAAIGSVALIVFVIVPALAGQLARLIPPQSEVALGKSVRGQIERVFGADAPGELICTGAEGRDALRAMTERVMAGESLPYPLTVAVFDHPLVNAFAMPGGQIVLFRGLIDAAEDPDEVAAVLAHEIGHVAARDPTRIALQAAGSGGILGLLLGDFAGGTIALALANRLITANYSQDAEEAADAYAVARLRSVDLLPEALATMFERLRAEHGRTSRLLSYFSTHPAFGDRIDAARAAPAGRTGPPALDDAQWRALRGICDAG